MAFVTCDFYSDVLEVGTSMTVLLPQATESRIGVGSVAPQAEPPVLYLLHGLSDDHTAWHRNTSVARYAEERGVAVVMPQVQRSFYADEPHGSRYWTFLSEELPEVVGAFFRLSGRREDTFVAGLSMGGYGALRWALRQPSRFAAAASLSGALDVAELARLGERRELFERVFGGEPGPDEDLFALLAGSDPPNLPALYVGCGTEDPLHDGSVRFVAAARGRGVQVRADFRAGDHAWALWDDVIQDVLAWLPIRGGTQSQALA